MKRRAAALMFCFLLAFQLALPSAQAADRVYFTAVSGPAGGATPCFHAPPRSRSTPDRSTGTPCWRGQTPFRSAGWPQGNRHPLRKIRTPPDWRGSASPCASRRGAAPPPWRMPWADQLQRSGGAAQIIAAPVQLRPEAAKARLLGSHPHVSGEGGLRCPHRRGRRKGH